MRVKNDTPQKKMKKSHISNMSQSYPQFQGFRFFQRLKKSKKTYTMMICYFFMEYQVPPSVICKYNYPPPKNPGLRLNINKINTRINMK